MNFDHIAQHITYQAKADYANAEPFPFVVIDDFLEWSDAEELYCTFPNRDETFYKYQNCFENKFAQDRVDKLPHRFATQLLFMNSGPFVSLMAKLTGIEGLLSDCFMRGGGAHVIERDGFLDIHSDFGISPKTGLYRRLNALLYLNKNYLSSQGGSLELWSTDMSRCVQSIEPRFNRFVLFETSATSYHGHTSRWTGDEPRRSVALYFYTSTPPEKEINKDSTKFQRLPSEPYDEKKEALRIQRNRGRLDSNV